MEKPHHFLVNLPVHNSALVAEFFKKLQFTELYPPLLPDTRLFSDGFLQVQLSAADSLRKGIAFFTGQPLDSLAAALQLRSVQTVVQDNKIRVIAPDGTAVYWLNLKDFAFPKLPPTGQSLCGSFYEVSLEVDDLEANSLFWKSMGFRKILPEGDRSNWLTMTNNLLRISLYEKGCCPHPFNSPALTWFNTDAPERLLLLEKRGFTFAHILPFDKDLPEEGILETPEGHHLFLFKAW